MEFSELSSRSPSKIPFIKFNTITDGFSEGLAGREETVLELVILTEMGKWWAVGVAN